MSFRIKSAMALIAFLVLPIVARAQSLTKDEATLRAYTLTMPKIDAWVAATLDVSKTLTGAHASDVTKSLQAETIAEAAELADGVPEMRRAIKKAGLTTREYATISLALMQALMMESVAESNPRAQVPDNMNPKNFTFIKANAAAVKAKFAKVEAASKGK